MSMIRPSDPGVSFRRRIRHGLMGALVLLTIAAVAMAANPFNGFDARSSRGAKLPADYNGWHMEDKNDASQGWMHLFHLKDGGWLTILFTVANMGPYKMSPSIGVLYSHPNGKSFTCQAMWPDGTNFHKPKPGKFWIGVNNSWFGGTYPNFYVKLKDGGCTSDIQLQSIVPSFTQGSGKATFYEDQSKQWTLIQISPRAKATGWIQFPQGRIQVDGDGYVEEVYTDVTVPALMDRWYILRSVNGPYTINLIDIVVDKKNFGNGHVRSLLLARDNQILMGTTQFQYEPAGGRKHAQSGINLPESFSLNARDGNLTLAGTVKTGKILDYMKLLSRLPTVARLFAGAIYGQPWQFRVAADYDLVLHESDKQTPIKGTGFEEIHYYDR